MFYYMARSIMINPFEFILLNIRRDPNSCRIVYFTS